MYTIIMKLKLLLSLPFLAIFILGSYWIKFKEKDQYNAQLAIEVSYYLNKYCMENKKYPKVESFKLEFKDKITYEWYYWPNKELDRVVVQYPYINPFNNALGINKISEFIPIIYAKTMKFICD